MSALDFHKFSKGETCSTPGCRSRSYYLEDGKRWCKASGHEQEGFTQITADEDDFNTAGRKSKKKREEREKVKIVHQGQQALGLYVTCVQLVLWKQVSWLVNEKQFPQELETVVRDLWAARLRDVRQLGENTGGSISTGWSGSEGETDDENVLGMEITKRLKKMARSQGVPKLIETLGLCYLGMVLMRLPVSLGEFQRWVEKDEILYLRVVSYFHRIYSELY
jgi:RNA polymerase I-specific transcription initiation factor RRN7